MAVLEDIIRQKTWANFGFLEEDLGLTPLQLLRKPQKDLHLTLKAYPSETIDVQL